jgi:hypothetical protein
MKIRHLIITLSLIFLLAASALAVDYRGRILVPSASTSTAVWYVNPSDSKRYYVSKAQDVEDLARVFGSQQSAATLATWLKTTVPKAQAGKLVYSVNKDGSLAKLYYVNSKYKLVDLGVKKDYLIKFKALAQTVKPTELAAIKSEYNLPKSLAAQNASLGWSFSWSYGGKQYKLAMPLSAAINKQYADSQKYFYYTGERPANWLETYYAMFLKSKANDNTFKVLTDELNRLAKENNLGPEETVDLATTFVQSLPYDFARAAAIKTAKPNYPYETLYKKTGICTDKSLLLIMILRQLGYGTALMNFPDVDHAAVGISCQPEYDFRDTGYCYIETTMRYPIAAYPQNFGNSGIVGTGSLTNYQGQFDKIFDSAPLGSYQMIQATKGKLYHGATNTHDRINTLKGLESTMASGSANIEVEQKAIASARQDLDALEMSMVSKKNSGDVAGYNALVPTYNAKAQAFNNSQENIKLDIASYNYDVRLYNQLVKDFYSSK